MSKRQKKFEEVITKRAKEKERRTEKCFINSNIYKKEIKKQRKEERENATE